MSFEDALDDSILDRITVKDGALQKADCPECEYSGENVELLPDGLSARLLCPECECTILDRSQFGQVNRARQM